MSEEEFFEEEVLEEEGGAEGEAEEIRAEGEMPLQELAKMTDIIDLMRRAVRGEIKEDEYRSKIAELFVSKETPREDVGKEERVAKKKRSFHKKGS